MKRVGVDVGGTFTDLIYVDDEAGVIQVHKLPTTPDDPSPIRPRSTRSSTARPSRPTS
jgi:N-methylhydantoinase A/oxoprolinase/acetone carboxylase beta subunit